MPKIMRNSLEGVGLRLRLLTESDLSLTLAWRNDPEICRWFVHSTPISEDQHRRWFASYCEKPDDLTFIIEDTSTFGCPVGQAALYRIDAACRSCEFGRLMIGDREARGHGLATRAIELLVEFAFDTLGMERVELVVLEGNIRARTLYERLGFATGDILNTIVAMHLDRSSHNNKQLRENAA